LTRDAFHKELVTYLTGEQNRIYRLAYSYMQNEQDALDVVQTAVVKALSAASMREPRYLKTWVYRIVVHTAIDSLRARRRLVLSDDWSSVEGQADVAMGVAAAPGADAGTDALDARQALGSLPHDLRAVVVLRYFHDLALREVAEVLDVNVNTVKTRLYRALRLLNVEMEDDYA
jgi:RNA polymerase sigma-70 factor (ECF subfamily)